MLKIGPILELMGRPLRMPMQYLESIWMEFSLTEMSCSRVAFVLSRRHSAFSPWRSLSFRMRTDSRISLTSFWRLLIEKQLKFRQIRYKDHSNTIVLCLKLIRLTHRGVGVGDWGLHPHLYAENVVFSKHSD